MSKSNSFKKSRKLALGIAVAMGCSFAAVAFADGANPVNDTDGLVFNTPITGESGQDTEYINANIIDDNNCYNFNNDVTISAGNEQLITSVKSRYTTYYRFCAPISSVSNPLEINMNNNKLNIYVTSSDWMMDAKKYVGIAAQKDCNVTINDSEIINIKFEESGGEKTGILAAAGGSINIKNGGENLENKILSIQAPKDDAITGIYVETKRSDSGNASSVIIDGLVNINTPDKIVNEADGTSYTVNAYAINVESGLVDIGGGKIIGRLRSDNWRNKIDIARININTQKDSNGNLIGAGDNIVQIDGELTADNGSENANQINVGLNGENSYIKGNAIGSAIEHSTKDNETSYDSTTKYGVNIYMDNAADWSGDAKGALTLRMHNGATWHGGSNAENDSYAINHMSMTIDTGAVWYNQGDTDIAVDYFTGGKDEAARGTIVMDGDKNITLSNYTGNTLVSFKHNVDDNNDVLGGNITIGSAAEGSVITLSTDNDGIDTSNAEEVTKAMNKLADKLTYTGAIDGAENNLDGYVQIAEGLTASSAALKLGDISFSAEDGKGSLKEGSIINPENKKNPEVIYGDKETAMMKGAKTAMASTALLWRAENNDLMKRMGDLRLSEGERGLWAKYYGGKYEMDSQNTDFNLKYNAYQLGYDADAGNGWTVGAAVSYNDGDATYGTGRGDLSAYSAGIYGTWKSEDGQYVDIIAKYSKLENDYKVFNDSGHKLSGDYKTWGTSISAEYGKRFENDNGFYFDPSVELTLGRINGKDYNAHSDYLDSVGVKKDMQVEQDAFNTLVGRVGFRLGQKLDNASYFVKLAAAHEFSGDFDTTFRAVNEPEGRTGIDFGDTWYEAQIGGTAKLSKNSLIYADFERSFGGDVEEKWRVDAGLRFTF